MSDQINRGRAKTAERDALLAHITPTADYAALADCDLVIKAVFEDRKVKAEAIGKAQAALGKQAILAPIRRPCRSPRSPPSSRSPSASSASISFRRSSG